MTNPMTMKLEHFAALSDDHRRQLDTLVTARRRKFPARATILNDGDACDYVIVILSGMAARMKNLPDGTRQIMAFLIPGDICDVEVFVLDRMDHSIGAMMPTEVAIISAETMRSLLTNAQELTTALWWSTMTDSAVLRARIIDHGRRDARERLAHLFCEMLVRYRMVGMAPGNSYPLPLSQEELADATGLTSVHVNRMLQSLRADSLIEYRARVLTVLDPRGLKRAAKFDGAYLHVGRSRTSGLATFDDASFAT